MAKKRQKGDTALRDRAAAALDATNYERFDARGPRTYLCRQRLAAWLDHAGPRPAVVECVRWLERVARA